jgi:hypothetical protein
MAYAGDLKSLALRGVRVRLPPRAPINSLCLWGYNYGQFLARPLRAARGLLPLTVSPAFKIFVIS